MLIFEPGHVEIVRILVVNKADVNLKYIPVRPVMTHDKRSPLSHAKNEEVRKILLEAGARK